MSLVLTPLTITELKTFFDDDALAVISYFLKKSIISQPEKLLSQEDLYILSNTSELHTPVFESLFLQNGGISMRDLFKQRFYSNSKKKRVDYI